MKLISLMIAALLALSATAAVPFYGRWNLNMSSSMEASSDQSTVHAPPAEMEPANLAGRPSNWEDPPPDGTPYDIHIRIGGPKQHIGTLRKYRLYWAIYNALKNVAEPLPSHSRSGNYIYQLCSPEEQLAGECKEWEEIKNIVYNAEPHDTYATNAHLNITMKWSEIHEGSFTGLRHEVYALIANAYRLMADQPDNCYEVNFPNSRRTTLCNVPMHMFVMIPAVNGDFPLSVVRVNMKLKFNGMSTEGDFPCQKSLTPIAELWRDKAAANFNKVLQIHNPDYNLYVSCQKESCFDVREDTHFGNPHKEADCDPFGDPWYTDPCGGDGKPC